MKTSVFYTITEPEFVFKQQILADISRNQFYKLVSSTGNGYELINSFYKQPLDIILINLFIPILSGVEVIKFIRIINKDIPIICYSDIYEPDIGYLLKPFKNVIYCQRNRDVLLDNLNLFFKNGFINNTIYRKKWAKERYLKIHKLIKKKLSSRYANIDFTAIEISLIKFTYMGFTNKEISLLMNLSIRTIETYLNDLIHELGIRSKIDLVRFAIEQDILHYILKF